MTEQAVMQPKRGLFARLALAIIAYFRTLFDAEFAAGVARLRRGELPAPEPEDKAPEPAKLEQAAPDSAMQLLGILQREGRFVDFLEEDIASFSDSDVGAAARVVHTGCRKALHEHFELVPVHSEDEGTSVNVETGFDPSAIRLTGNVVGEPPFKGTLQHRGWRVAGADLPQIAETHDVRVIAPAEVEL